MNQELSVLLSSGNVKLEINYSDLHACIEDVVKKTTGKLISEFMKDQSSELITRSEAKQMLGIKSDGTMIEWERKGFLQSYKKGGRIFYKKDEVLSSAESVKRTYPN